MRGYLKRTRWTVPDGRYQRLISDLHMYRQVIQRSHAHNKLRYGD